MSDERHALRQLARTDDEASQLIMFHISGYATLRKFYELRDEEAENLTEEQAERRRISGSRPRERKKNVAKSLIALIDVAAASVHGGLFDPEAATVVQVDGLLTLLGEVLPLLDRKSRFYHSFEVC
jgi:hypothetical protein